MNRRTQKPKRRTRTHHPEPGTRNRTPRFWHAALITLAGAFVYANSLSAPFIFDDEASIVQNGAIRSPRQVLTQERDTPLAGRPIAGLTFALNFAASGLDARAYRMTNIAIHLACALLLFALVSRTLMLPRMMQPWRDAAPDLAFATALLWVVHPLTTDAVTYITQRTESLMAMFFLLTLYASLRAHSSKHPVRWQTLAVLACGCGMASKESMAPAPLIVALFDRIFIFSSWREAFSRRWGLYVGLALSWSILAVLVAPGPRAGSAGLSSAVDVYLYLLNQGRMIARYLRLAFWPTDLVINYGPPLTYSPTDVWPYVALAAGLLIATILLLRRIPPAGFLGVWFFFSLAPSSSFVPISTEVGAERRMYLPLMALLGGVVISTHWLIGRQQRPRRSIAVPLLIAAAAALGTATILRNREYQSWLTLARTTLDRWPTDVARGAVGSELARLHRDQEALPYLQIAALTDARARYNLGTTLYNLKRYDEAIRELDLLVGRYPTREEVPWSHRMMGYAHARMSRWPEAISELRVALSMNPRDLESRRILVDAHNAYGVQLARTQKYDDAVAHFRRGLALDENNVSLRYNLAAALADSGDVRESFTEARRVVTTDPAHADAHNLLGRLLAIEGHFQEALVNLETAVKLRPADAAFRDDLGRVQKLVAK